MSYYYQVAEAATLLTTRLGELKPEIGIVLGSGLGAVADAVTDAITCRTAKFRIFRSPRSRATPGRIVAGRLGGVPVVVMQGRVHFYEGYSPLQVTFPMRVLGALGMRAVVLTNAAGGIGEATSGAAGAAGRPYQPDGLESA